MGVIAIIANIRSDIIFNIITSENTVYDINPKLRSVITENGESGGTITEFSTG